MLDFAREFWDGFNETVKDWRMWAVVVPVGIVLAILFH